MKNYCALPFGHVNIKTDGSYQMCCLQNSDHGINIARDSHEQWLDSDFVSQFRQDFKQDQRHPACKECWNREDIGMSSLRQRSAKEYRILGINNFESKIVNVEVMVGNLCNLKCIMCNENNSSALLAENKKLKITSTQPSQYQWSKQSFENLSNLLSSTKPKVISIRGGEPFYNKDLLKVCQNLDDDVFQKTLLHVTTNGTVWSSDWHAVLSKFKLVRIMFSIDATEKLFEYIRFPANWTTVDKNVSIISQLPNVKSVINCVVQNMNISNIGSVIEYAEDKGIFLQFDKLTKPNFMQFTNLPQSSRQYAIEHLNKIIGKIPKYSMKLELEAMLHNLQNTAFDCDEWQQFVDFITPRDQIRGNDYSVFIKE